MRNPSSTDRWTSKLTGPAGNAPPEGQLSGGFLRGRISYPFGFLAVWIALGILLVACWIWVPRSVSAFSFRMSLPFMAFLAIAAMGQTLVLMMRGIDLSAPAIIAAASMVLVGTSGSTGAGLWLAIPAALSLSVAIGAVNGLLIAVLRLNALIVTMAVSAIVGGGVIYYSRVFASVATAPDALQNFVGSRPFGLPVAVWVALGLLALLTLWLRKTKLGRNFQLAGANPAAAHASGLATTWYQMTAYVGASLLYGTLAILLSGFIGNPTTSIGNPYLLAPIAAAVLGGTAMNGGIASMIAVVGASAFLIQLEQASKMLGLESSWQMIVQGLAIAIGMWMSRLTATSRQR